MRPMSRVNMLLLFGLLTMVVPFSGLPISLRTLLQIVFGACVLGIGLAMRAEESRKLHQPAEPELPSASEPPSSISPI